jgi:hypothetical protein
MGHGRKDGYVMSRILGELLEVHFDPEDGGSTRFSEAPATLLISTQFRYPREESNSSEEI